jgi:hypothetical protein
MQPLARKKEATGTRSKSNGNYRRKGPYKNVIPTHRSTGMELNQQMTKVQTDRQYQEQ